MLSCHESLVESDRMLIVRSALLMPWNESFSSINVGYEHRCGLLSDAYFLKFLSFSLLANIFLSPVAHHFAVDYEM